MEEEQAMARRWEPFPRIQVRATELTVPYSHSFYSTYVCCTLRSLLHTHSMIRLANSMRSMMFRTDLTAKDYRTRFGGHRVPGEKPVLLKGEICGSYEDIEYFTTMANKVTTTGRMSTQVAEPCHAL